MPKIKGGARQGSPKASILYIEKDTDRDELGTHNLVSPEGDSKSIAKEFIDNNSGRGSRTYYHDHVSFHPNDRKKCTPEFMRDFSEGYIKTHYNNQQAYWGVHREKEHVHVHFCVSATDMDGKKLQLKNKDLGNRDRYVQDYAKERGMHYMDRLDLKMQKGRDKIRQAEKERGLKPDKEKLREKIQYVINHPDVQTREDFKKWLEISGLPLSERKTGIEFKNRIYRFKTLGYDKETYRGSKFKDYLPESIIKERMNEKKFREKIEQNKGRNKKENTRINRN